VLTKTGHVPLWRVVSMRKTMEKNPQIWWLMIMFPIYICLYVSYLMLTINSRYTNIPYFQTSKYDIADSISRKCPYVLKSPIDQQLCQVSPGRSDSSVDMVPRRSWLGRVSTVDDAPDVFPEFGRPKCWLKTYVYNVFIMFIFIYLVSHST
jgi:hypothetical protein